jgi:hypothetical protein
MSRAFLSVVRNGLPPEWADGLWTPTGSKGSSRSPSLLCNPADEARVEQLREECCPPSPKWLWPGYHCPLDKELQRAYGFGCDHYWRVFVSQGEVCGVCKQPPGKARLVVDEDEDTHEFRGEAHRGCNGKITPEIVRYVLDPPARKVGRFVIPAEKFARRQKRLADKAKARRARKAAAQQVSPVEAGGYAASLAAARKARR